MASLFTKNKSAKAKDTQVIRVLFDSGCSTTLINKSVVQDLTQTKVKPSTWKTKSGNFTTDKECNIKFILPAFHENRIVEWKASVENSPRASCRYDMIVGRDLMHEIGFDILFSKAQMIWDNATVPMRPVDDLSSERIAQLHREIYLSHDPLTTEAERIQSILDAKYSPANLDELSKGCKNLTQNEQKQLHKLLNKYEHLFDGSLGNWDTEPVDIELKDPNCKPYHARAYPVPQSAERKLKDECQRYCDAGILRKINRSEWAAPAFTIYKPDGSLRSIANFIELNKHIRRKPFPIPKISDMLYKLEGFRYATALDLNMGYYHIALTPKASSYCTVVFPWGKYEYLRLPMGLCNSPDIFQERMSSLVHDLTFVRAYLDDLLIVSKDSFTQHLDHMEQVFTRLSEANLKINATKSKFCTTQLEYLGYTISRQGVQPSIKKVTAILDLKAPETKKQLRKFIGMVNYYRDIWPKRSHMMAPLSALTSSKTKWKWENTHQEAFEEIKKEIAKETLLAYPDFNKPFEIHTDASKLQLGACISQDNRPIAFYSRKLNPAQTRYTTTERELLSIVETLKEFKTILFGQQIKIHTDHENLTSNTLTSDRVMRWRLYIEEYSPDLHYIKGEDNVVADALSRMDTENTKGTPEFLHCFTVDDSDYAFHPLSYSHLHKAQELDTQIKKILHMKDTLYELKEYHGGGKLFKLICYKSKIVVPKSLQNHIVDWYHTVLCHPGINRTEETIGQHLWWPLMRKHITNYVVTCHICQRNKRKQKKYGTLPPKLAEATPWDILCLDLIGPYIIRRKGLPDLVCKCVTMIDPATGWFEIHQYDDKRSITVANITEQEWFSRYPWPTQVTFDRGSEFIGQDFKKMIAEDYGIKGKPITVRNPQANAIVERIHQVIANIIRTFELENNYLDEEDPWKGILSATAFAIRSTLHTTLKKTPGQLVFGRDMIFNVQHTANWEFIKQRKQRLIDKNNKQENAKRIPYTYKVGDKVLLRRGTENKYETPYSGPHTILQVYDNGTVSMQVKSVIDRYNIRRLTPYSAASTQDHGGECSMRTTKTRRSSRKSSNITDVN